VISAYNEAAVIGAKLDNALGLDYPGDPLEVVVVSDASTDGTDEIVGSTAPHGVSPDSPARPPGARRPA
jgi:cellulose synthase/poly-beta-1,6-N-acetylglucosamine synthase-like glycosyltransferase